MASAWILVCIVLVISSAYGQPYNVISQNVQFMSDAPSGNIMLLGTLTTPEGAPQPVPGIVLVAGSGPGQRNESIAYGPFFNFALSPPRAPSCGQSMVDVAVFVDIAEYFTSQGFAVLRYDKRSCLAGSGVPGCQYPLCPLNETNPPSNCVNLHTITTQDLIIDIDSAVLFLANTAGVNGKNITLIGHSEGTLLVPYSGNNNPALVQQIVLLSGPGLPLTDVVIDQLERSVVWAETILNVCAADNIPAPVINELRLNLNLTEQLLVQTENITTFILNGSFADTDLVTWLSPNVPVGYVKSLYNIGQFNAMFNSMNLFTKNGGKILSINSPTDMQIYAKIFQPLHAALLGLPIPQTVAIVDDLTHVLTPADFSSGSVSPKVFEAILNWGQ